MLSWVPCECALHRAMASHPGSPMSVHYTEPWHLPLGLLWVYITQNPGIPCWVPYECTLHRTRHLTSSPLWVYTTQNPAISPQVSFEYILHTTLASHPGSPMSIYCTEPWDPTLGPLWIYSVHNPEPWFWESASLQHRIRNEAKPLLGSCLGRAKPGPQWGRCHSPGSSEDQKLWQNAFRLLPTRGPCLDKHPCRASLKPPVDLCLSYSFYWWPWQKAPWGGMGLLHLIAYSPSSREVGARTQGRNWCRDQERVLITGLLI